MRDVVSDYPALAAGSRRQETPAGPGETVSVVGARGFLGRHICDRLASRGHTVHGFDRDMPAMTAGAVDPLVLASGYVVWAASSINPMIAANDPDRIALDADVFSAFIAGLARRAGGPRVILLSSGGTVYDTAASPPYSEASPVRPRTAYGAAKLELERLLLASQSSGLVLRLSNAYGPGQPVAPGQGVIAHWFNAIAAGHAVHIFGDPGTARDYVYVHDIAEAVTAVVEQAFSAHRVLNIGAGRPTTLATLFDAVVHVTGATGLAPLAQAARRFDSRSTWLDCDRAATSIGWRAQTSLVDGLTRTWTELSNAGKAAVEPADGRVSRMQNS